MAPSNPHDRPVVLYDGDCNLCSASVAFIIDRDPSARFRFASLQSGYAKEALARAGVTIASDPESVVLMEGERVYERSSAVLRIAKQLRGVWKLLYAFIVIPAPVRDLVYGWIAGSRYRWFGRRTTCRVPTDDVRGRFLA